MKKRTPNSRFRPWNKRIHSAATLLSVIGLSVFSNISHADVVYVSSAPQNCTVTANCPGPNPDGTYTEIGLNVGDYGARGTAIGRPAVRPAPRGYISGTSLTDTTAGIDLKPVLGVANAIYQIDYNFSSTAGNTSTNVIMSASCTDGTLSFTETDKMQRQYGNPANQWQLMGFITNTTTTPTISLRYKSGEVNGTSQNRLIIDCWRFTQVTPCLAVPVVSVTGPLSTNSNQVIVTGVSNAATAVTIYQKSGGSFVAIGSKTTDVTGGNNSVTVSGLVKGAEVGATQTINGQEGCVPTAGTIVGGANGGVRIALSVRETSDQGPVGVPATTTSSANLHFLGATTVSGGAPVDAPIVYPSNTWQTVTWGGVDRVGSSSNAIGTLTSGTFYPGGSSVAIRVYAYRIINDERIYSETAAESSAVSSNETFGVNWTWAPVSGADGYRVLRNYYGDFVENADVTTNSLNDDGSVSWGTDPTITPNSASHSPSVQWNPTAGTQNNIATRWAILESLAFAIADTDNTGPFDLYIDNIQNGTNVFRTFENAVAGTSDFGFRTPSFSGSTSANLLAAPNISTVTNSVADSGTKSLHISFQWNGTNVSKWLRLTTSAAISGTANPLINLDDPISIRLLFLPAGTPLPPAPAAPSLSASSVDGKVVLNWTGTHRLQTSTDVTGAYTNAPSTTADVANPTPAPYTNQFPETQKFFRLKD